MTKSTVTRSSREAQPRSTTAASATTLAPVVPTRVALTDINLDASQQTRAALDDRVVADYADRMTEGDAFPPVTLFRDPAASTNQYSVGNGWHRIRACQQVGYREIDAEIREGSPTDALWYALGANRTNGHRMSPKDKTHAIQLALETWPEKSTSVLAEQIGCSQSLVQQVKAEAQVSSPTNLPERVIGKDGKGYPARRSTASAAAVPPFEPEHETAPAAAGTTNEAGRDRKHYPADRPKSAPVDDPHHDAIVAAVREGKRSKDISKELGVREEAVATARRELGVAGPSRARKDVQARRARLETMAASGCSIPQIASELGVSEATCRETAKRHRITLTADAVTRGRRRIDANQIVCAIVQDGENLLAGVNVIDFRDLDWTPFPEWVRSLQQSHTALGAFIKRLQQEHPHGEAA
jgi:transposase